MQSADNGVGKSESTDEGVGGSTTTASRESVWNNVSLCVYRWIPKDSIKAVVYISHGIGEHMGRYEQLGQHLADSKILAFGHDHVGHGRSEGDRVHVNTFNTYVMDIINHIRDFKSEYPGVPCFLVGHSMGGLIASLVAIEIQDDLSGVVFSAPAIEITNAGPVSSFLVSLLGSILPQFGVKAVEPSLISSIPEEVESYQNDPLVYHMPMKAKLLSEFISSIKASREKIDVVTIPVLVFHGTEDHLVPFSASEYINSKIGSTDKTFESFQGNFHEVLHDKGQKQARELVKDWIVRHVN